MRLRIAFLLVAGVWTVSVAQRSVHAEQGKTVWDGVFTAEQAKRGEAAYTENCASCHGGDMAGDGFAPPLSGSDFAGNWNDLTVGDLFERIRISMPPTGPSSVQPQGKADIVAHILNVNKYPAGTAELEPKTEVLKQIKIEMKK
jgi:S-disulfanyl-L-cysteine oxidoreductase SoxD